MSPTAKHFMSLMQSHTGDWTSSRGAFLDPSPFRSLVQRAHFKLKTDRGDYQEDLLKLKAKLRV